MILESGALKTKDPKTISQEALIDSLIYSSGLKKKKDGLSPQFHQDLCFFFPYSCAFSKSVVQSFFVRFRELDI